MSYFLILNVVFIYKLLIFLDPWTFGTFSQCRSFTRGKIKVKQLKYIHINVIEKNEISEATKKIDRIHKNDYIFQILFR